MVNVSNEYLEKINSVSKTVYWFGKVTLKNGTEYEFDIANLAQGKTKIRKELCASKFGIGGTCSAELTLALMLDYDSDTNTYSINGLIVNRYDFYDAEVTLTFRLYLDDDDESIYEDVFLGTYTVTSPERSRLILTLTAYDYMQKFGQPCVSELQGSIYNNLLNACTICGVEFGNTLKEITNMANGNKNIAEYDPKNQIQTWRDAIGYMAAVLGANAIIKNDKLYIVPFKQTIDRYVTSGERVSLTLEDYHTSYGVIKSVNLRNNTEEKVTIDDSLLTYNLTSNPLIQYTTDVARKEVLSNILTNLHALNFIPFKSEMFNDPSYELGDVIDFSENHAENSTKCVVTSMQITLNGHMALECDGDDPYLKKTEESASSEHAQSTSGSIGTGVKFYDYVNEIDVTIPDNTETEIVSLTYAANGKYRQEFLSELKIGVTTNETSTSTEYTENDLDILVTYYLNGQEIISYHPETTFADGVFLLHLFYFWNSDMRIPEGTFSATLHVSGGSAVILSGNNHSRIMQSGTSYGESSNRLEYIDVVQEPTKYSYKIGETLDYSGLIIKAFYEDGHAVDVTSQCTFDPENGSTVGNGYYINVKAQYEENGKIYRAAFGLEINPVTEIVVSKPPTKTFYRVGETIDYTGMKIDAIYDNGTHVTVTNECTYSPSNGSIVSANTDVLLVTISYNYHGRIYKTVYDGLTLHKLLILDVSKDPTKDEYFVGESIDLSGVEITAEYTDDTSAVVTNSCTFNPTSGTEITQEGAVNVAVSYTEDGVTKTTVIPLVAIKVIPDELEIKPPTKTSYRVGESLDLTGCVVKAKYNNGTKETVTSDCTFSPSNGATISTSTSVVTVSYTYNDVTVVDTIDIDVVTLDEIAVTPPSRVNYREGEILDYTGVAVSAVWSDGSTDDVTSQCTFSPANGSTASANTSVVTVTYAAQGNTFTDTFDLEVATFEGIEVTHDPIKIVYWEYERLNLAGTVISALWSDDSKDDVTEQCTFNPANNEELTTSKTAVNVSYLRNGTTYRTTIPIEVNPIENPELPYFYYTYNARTKVITISRTDVSQIETARLATLTVPSSFTDANGISWTVVVN